MTSGWPVEILTDEGVACGAVLWRHQRRLRLTVVVKARFTWVHEGPMLPSAAPDIAREDRTFDRSPYRSLETSSDLAPYLGRCDVLFRGHAYAPRGQAVPTGAVRIAIFREARPLLDKTLHVLGDLDASGSRRPFTRMPIVYERAFGGPTVPSNPVGTAAPSFVCPNAPAEPAGFGPISPYWPARRRLAVTNDDPSDGLLDLPDTVAWAYFQAAPPDQQIEMPQGGEWLVLDGLHPTLPRVQTRLPNARGAARMITRGPAGTAEIPLDLVADTLSIDGDTQQCTILWRGVRDLGDEPTSLSAITIAAGLERPERPVPWARLTGSGPSSMPMSTPGKPRLPTMALTIDQQESEAREPATPFTRPPPAPAPVEPRIDDPPPWAPPSSRPPPPSSRPPPPSLEPVPPPTSLGPPPMIGPISVPSSSAAPEPVQVAPAVEAPPAAAAPPLAKKLRKGGVTAADAAAFLRAFDLPPPERR